MNAVLIRLLQAALDNLLLPSGIQRAQVITKMPVSGWPAMPFITVNLELIQQTHTEIGEDVENPGPDNIWTLFAMAQRTWRVTITAPDAEERDFYRDTLLAVLRILDATVFSDIGLNNTHSLQAASYPVAKERDGRIPGFYCADIVLDTDSNFSTSVRTDYPIILGISPNGTYSPSDFTVVLNPSANG
jgi:hypothetical protein